MTAAAVLPGVAAAPRSRAVLVVTVAAAAIPTALSAQGMVSVATDALRLPGWTAVGLAGFLELALVASAMAAREATARGRSARVDLAATWCLSAVSGALSGLHELVSATGVTLAPLAVLAALVRVVAPLVACWLWHRVVTGDVDAPAGRSRAARQAEAARLRVAVAARRVHQHDTPAARRSLERAHRALLRRHPDTTADEVSATVAALAAVDALPALAGRGRHDAPTTAGAAGVEHDAPAAAAGGAAPAGHDVPATTGHGDQGDQGEACVSSSVLTGCEVALPGLEDDPSPVSSAQPPATLTDPLAVALAVLADQGEAATGPAVREALAAAGHVVSDRTARRWLATARAHQVATSSGRDRLAVVI